MFSSAGKAKRVFGSVGKAKVFFSSVGKTGNPYHVVQMELRGN